MDTLPPFPYSGAMLVDGLGKIIADKLGLDDDEVTPDKHIFDDLAADSLDGVELIMEMEEFLSKSGTEIKIPDDDAAGMGRLRQMAWYAWERLPESAKIGHPPPCWPLSTDEEIEARKKAS